RRSPLRAWHNRATPERTRRPSRSASRKPFETFLLGRALPFWYHDDVRSPRLTTSDLRDLLAQRVVVFDGAMGTQLQARKLTAEDFGGEEQAGCNENLAVTRPDVIAAVHRAYYEAGADFVETDTFGGTPLVLGEFGLADKAVAINEAAARVAREVAEDIEKRDGRARYVAGSMGPTTRTISVTGGITFDEMSSHYEQQ